MSATPGRRLPPFRLLDAWRGIASLAVVGYHWADIALRRFPALEGHWLYALSKFGFLGVQLFFVISGYCIASAAINTLRRNEGVTRYAQARAWRIYPTYWAGLALTALFILTAQLLAAKGVIGTNIYTEIDLTRQSFSYYFANLTLTMTTLRQPMLVAVAWTLCYEVAFYALVGIALIVARGTKKPELLLPLLHGLTIVSLVLTTFAPHLRLFPLDLWAQFGLGVLLFDLLMNPLGDSEQRSPQQKRQTQGWALAIIGLTVALILAHDTEVRIGWMSVPSPWQFSAALVFALYLYLTYRFDEQWSNNRVVKALSWIGVFSYSLYLTHVVTIRVVSLGLQKLSIGANYHYLAYLAALLTAISAAYVFYLLFEKPVIHRGKKRVSAGTAPVGTAPAETINPGEAGAVRESAL